MKVILKRLSVKLFILTVMIGVLFFFPLDNVSSKSDACPSCMLEFMVCTDSCSPEDSVCFATCHIQYFQCLEVPCPDITSCKN